MSSNETGPGRDWHIGEAAELYALGALEPTERARVELHVATCVACERALGVAATTVTALDDAFIAQDEPPARLGARIAASAVALAQTPTPLPRTPRTPFRAALIATAAAVLLGAGIGGGALAERAFSQRLEARESAVLATLATSHFNHTALRARSAGAAPSKVLYARDGSWLYVVIASAACRCRVVAQLARGVVDLGPPEARAGTSWLFTRIAGRPRSVRLLDAAGNVVADAALTYEAK